MKPASPSTKHDIFDKVASRQNCLPFASVRIFACVWVINFGRTFFCCYQVFTWSPYKTTFLSQMNCYMEPDQYKF